jgi:hypothetical protein
MHYYMKSCAHGFLLYFLYQEVYAFLGKLVVVVMISLLHSVTHTHTHTFVLSHIHAK